MQVTNFISDKVGLGLNLNIRRIIFYSMKKFHDNSIISPSLTKQIAGRSGLIFFIKKRKKRIL
jgi:hypothetical protein